MFVKIATSTSYKLEEIAEWPPEKINRVYLEIVKQEFYNNKLQAVLHGVEADAIGEFEIVEEQKTEKAIATMEDLHDLGKFAPSVKRGE